MPGMTSQSTPFVFAGLLPHPPIIVPDVGRGREAPALATVAACRELARRMVTTLPEALILLSPHSPRRRGSFGYWAEPQVAGSLVDFGAPGAAVALPNDHALAENIAREGRAEGLEFQPIQGEALDHGAIVPLWFLAEAGWTGPTVLLGLSIPSDAHLEELGRAIARAAARDGRRIALIASGDMSHRLTHGSPGRYHPDARHFDLTFADLVRDRRRAELLEFDPELRDAAGQDVLETTAVVLTALGAEESAFDLLSYEGPFGVGYSVAVFAEHAPIDLGAIEREDPEDLRALLPSIAREALESYIRTGKPAITPREARGILSSRAGLFVTIWRNDGSLRGCIGIMGPSQPNLIEQTIDRAVAVAKWAYGGPVTESELDNLEYEVSVLSPLEPVVSIDELDPARYGIYVTDAEGHHAVLLPGIESIKTVEDQLRLIRKKGHIPDDAEIAIQRFTARKFHEVPRQPAATAGEKPC